MTKILLAKAKRLQEAWFILFTSSRVDAVAFVDVPKEHANNSLLYAERSGDSGPFRLRPLDGTEWSWFRNNEPERIVQAPGSGFRE